MNEPTRQEKLLRYLEIFETGVNKGNDDDIITDFVVSLRKSTLMDENENESLADSVKDNLKSFLGDMLDRMDDIEQESSHETALNHKFSEAPVGEQLEMWDNVTRYTDERYEPRQLDAEGFRRQLGNGRDEAVLRTFAKDWGRALRQRVEVKKQQIFVHEASVWTDRLQDIKNNDYAVRREVSVMRRKYPVIDELALIIGRLRHNESDEKDYLKTEYLPSSLSVNRSVEEFDGITSGNNLERVIPSEFVYLAEPAAQNVFYKRYAMKQLSQFLSPGKDRPIKRRSRKPMPRLVAGPIIVSIDTSESMSGLSQNIANTMIYRLVEIARKARRRLFIITFSVRCRSYEVTPNDRWEEVAAFLDKHYSGGTNGEKMLNESIDTLQTSHFEMADVLIISDFAFPEPLKPTLARIKGEQDKGTRFHGLMTSPVRSVYADILDTFKTVSDR